MMSRGKSTDIKDSLRSELESSRLAFHTLLDSLSDADLKKKSHNAAWTNKHIIVHMAMGFFILPSLILLALLFGRLPKPISKLFALLLTVTTIPFNWINALGPYIGGTIFTRKSLSKTFDWFHARIVQLLHFMTEEGLKRGMYKKSAVFFSSPAVMNGQAYLTSFDAQMFLFAKSLGLRPMGDSFLWKG